jgi:hypothetical protein
MGSLNNNTLVTLHSNRESRVDVPNAMHDQQFQQPSISTSDPEVHIRLPDTLQHQLPELEAAWDWLAFSGSPSKGILPFEEYENWHSITWLDFDKTMTTCWLSDTESAR